MNGQHNMTTLNECYHPHDYSTPITELKYSSQGNNNSNITWIVHVSCTIPWNPNNDDMANEKVFLLYAFFLSFLIPVPLVSLFYILVIVKLARTGRSKGASQGNR